MAIARPILGLVAIALLAGGIVMQFLIVLSGLSPSPLNKVYFLEADTSSILNANSNFRNPARWTFLDICGVQDGLNYDCTSTRAAQSFDVVKNFGTTDGVPTALDAGKYYYYMSRFAWAFYIIALFFAVVAFLLSVFALFARLGAYLTGFTSLLAVFFQALAASLMTAWVVKGRAAFESAGSSATIGRYAMGFTWGTFAAFFLAAVFFCVGGAISKSNSTQKKSYFGRKRSTRSRGSFVDSSSDRRAVKDEYE